MSIIDESPVDVRAVPIRLSCWRRPSETYQVLQQLKKLQPRTMLITCDGPRSGVFGEKEKIKLVREIIDREIDWDCDVYKLYRDKNFRECTKEEIYAPFYNKNGKKLDFFNGEVPAIIWLEDDNLPNMSFFRFCAEMLEKYKDNENVWRITGNNFQYGITRGDSSYYFSHLPHTWGGGLWWNKHREFYTRRDEIDQVFYKLEKGEMQLPSNISPAAIKFYMEQCSRVYYGDLKGSFDDYLMVLFSYAFSKYTIIPNSNLVKNIGFCPVDGSNCLYPKSNQIIETQELAFPLQDPTEIEVCSEADNFYYSKVLGIQGV